MMYCGLMVTGTSMTLAFHGTWLLGLVVTPAAWESAVFGFVSSFPVSVNDDGDDEFFVDDSLEQRLEVVRR